VAALGTVLLIATSASAGGCGYAGDRGGGPGWGHAGGYQETFVSFGSFGTFGGDDCRPRHRHDRRHDHGHKHGHDHKHRHWRGRDADRRGRGNDRGWGGDRGRFDGKRADAGVHIDIDITPGRAKDTSDHHAYRLTHLEKNPKKAREWGLRVDKTQKKINTIERKQQKLEEKQRKLEKKREDRRGR
jgi:hypothetical protein